MNALFPLIILSLLAAGGGDTSATKKKKKAGTWDWQDESLVNRIGPMTQSEASVFDSDWINSIRDNASWARKELEDVDGMAMAVALAFGIPVKHLVMAQGFLKLTHVVFPGEGEDRLEQLAEAANLGLLEGILGIKGVGGAPKTFPQLEQKQ